MSTDLRDLDTFKDYLRSAQPRLIITCENKGRSSSLTPHIGEVDRGWDEVISEGYDPDHSPLGPVYWRIVKRGDERFYCSTFPVRRDGYYQCLGGEGTFLLQSPHRNCGRADRNAVGAAGMTNRSTTPIQFQTQWRKS